MKKKYHSLPRFLLYSAGIFCSASIAAQNKTITGLITYGDTPLAGVKVHEMGSSSVFTTARDGRFQLLINGESALIVVQHPRYGIRRVSAEGRSSITIDYSLKEREIEEVILNAGYYKVSEKERTGSIVKIASKEIENQPVNNVLSALQGRVPGLTIIQNTGTPGGGFDIQIRGKNSIRSYATTNGTYEANKPLYIVDGMILSQGDEYKANLSASILPFQDSNPLSFLNPNDIESIEVLKDADATAIYGARGANGVILITTKKGKRGSTSVQFNSSFGLGEIATMPKMMTTEEYIAFRKVGFANDGIAKYPNNAYDINGVWNASKNTDWQNYFLRNKSERQSNEVRISGGSERTQFVLSGGHDEETTVFPGDYRYKKTKWGINLSHLSTDQKLRVQFSSFYTLQKNFLPPTDFMSVYKSLAPNAPDLYTLSGDLNWENGTFVNPMAAASQNYRKRQNSLVTNIGIHYKLLKGLFFQLNGGYSQNTTYDRKIKPKTFYNPTSGIGSERSSISKSRMESNNWLVEPQLNYRWEDEVHQLDALVGSTFQDQTSNFEMLTGSNFPSDALLENIGSASEVKIVGSESSVYRYTAVYARFNYQYKKRYILNITGRRDGSSRFGPNRRFANFGAVGGAWIFSKEGFAENWEWLNFGKLRGSYGTAGSDNIGNYQYYDTYGNTGSLYDGSQAMTPSRLYNADYGWEITKKLEMALDLGFFNDRLTFSGSYYRNRSGNQLVGVPLPSITGFTNVQANLDALVENRGWEVSFGGTPVEHKNFTWQSSFNISFPTNELISFPDLGGSTYASLLMIGRSTSIKKLYHYLGVNSDTGLYEFEDVNKDGKYDITDRTSVKDIGMRWFGGWQNTLRFKNWSLGLLTQISSQTRENLLASHSMIGGMMNIPIEFDDYWTLENKDAKYQKPTSGSNASILSAYYNFMLSDAIVSDFWYFRLKNVQLSYMLPSSVFKKGNANIYFQGQNIWTWSNAKNIDPEYTLSGYIPPLRVWSLGFTLNF